MILDDIISRKKITLKEIDYKLDIFNIAEKLKTDNISSFYEAIKKDGLSIIGEIKKASPSRGIIKENFNPVEIAKQYENTVDAVSVLTEEHFFKGSNEYLENVHENIKLPIIRKDFIISPLQIFEAREIGASAVLLIVAILKDSTIISEFIKLAKSIGLDCLVETHNEKEIETALEANAEIIGINNRNLYDFSEDINTTLKLSKMIPDNILKVSESSIHTSDDIKIIKQAGVDAVLVGESFMKADDIAKKAKEFKEAYEI